MEFDKTYRPFSGIEDTSVDVRSNNNVGGDYNSLLSKLREDILGFSNMFISPFGQKQIIYADWTASGRALASVENFVVNEVLPHYGNTHTAATITGHQSTCFRAEARQIVGQAVNAKVTGKAAEDVVLFVGNGTTATVHKLVESLGLNIPLPEDCKDSMRPVVFVSSYEHHSNLLPWRESAADVVVIAYNHITGVCLEDLRAQLIHYGDRIVKIGSFSACSNVTGLLTDVDAVSILLHLHGALAVFDYATAAPYIKMDMNPVLPTHEHGTMAYKDAIFFSGHKFLGGPGCPGVLVVKKSLLPSLQEAPTLSGGGTVFYVTDKHHRYLSNPEEREEAGTPHLIADVRMGLAMNIKQSFGAAWVEAEEIKVSAYVQDRLASIQAVVMLGRSAAGPPTHKLDGRHLPIFSFLIRCGDKFLHFHFVTALLNDIFGVQSRGGCMCAGPFSQLLLGIDETTNERFEKLLLEKHEVYRPGYTRVSFPFWMSKSEIDYIINSVAFVAEHGWKFLKLYRYNHKTGEWAHTTRLTRFPERKWLSKFSFCEPRAHGTERQSLSGDLDLHQLLDSMQAAALELANMHGQGQATSFVHSYAVDDEPLNSLRWFILPEDVVQQRLSLHITDGTITGPIQPPHIIDLENRSKRFKEKAEEDLKSIASSQALTGSAYLLQRDKKLKAHSSGVTEKPRYLSLAESMKAKQVKPVDAVSKIAPQNLTQCDDKVQQGPDILPIRSIAREEDGRKESTNSDEITCPGPEPMQCTTGCAVSRKVLSGPGVSYWSSDSVAPNDTKKLFHCPPKKIMKLVGQAVKEWDMIRDGYRRFISHPTHRKDLPSTCSLQHRDRLLLGLSGGKDSLAMLHTLVALQKRAPVKFSIACATVDPQTESFDPSPLIPYLQSLNITYHYLSEPIVSLAKSKLQGDSLCAFCSRFKRGLLYSCCRNNNYNKLVLAQHLDDLAESFLMSALHNGQIRTMKANYAIEAGDVQVIRPFIYIREHQTKEFSMSCKLPIINENCPACFEQPKERARVKKVLAQEESMIPALFFNLRKALLPLMHDDSYVAMNQVVERIERNGYKVNSRLPEKASRRDDLSAEVIPANKRVKPDEELSTNNSKLNSSAAHPIGAGGVGVGDSSCTQCFEIA